MNQQSGAPAHNFKARRDAALNLLAATGIRKSNYCPPVLRLLWRLGLQVPPPHFASFGGVAATAGVLFATLWGSAMWLITWSSGGMSLAAALGTAALGGTLFGLSLGSYYAFGRKLHQLPAWQGLEVTGGA